MLKTLLRRVLPLVVLGSLTLSSCVVHEHDRGPRGPAATTAGPATATGGAPAAVTRLALATAAAHY